jgi:hypothetical protein
MTAMIRLRTDRVEADLAALRHTAERARTALACLFSSSAEFEAEVIRTRRVRSVMRRPTGGRVIGTWVATMGLTFVFLML